MPKMIVDSGLIIESAMLSSAFKSMVAGNGEAWTRYSKGRTFYLQKIGDTYEVKTMPETVVPTMLPKAKTVPKPPASPPPVSPLMTTSKAASKAAASKAATPKPTPKVKAMPKPKAVAKVQARVSLKRVFEEDDPMDCS